MLGKAAAQVRQAGGKQEPVRFGLDRGRDHPRD